MPATFRSVVEYVWNSGATAKLSEVAKALDEDEGRIRKVVGKHLCDSLSVVVSGSDAHLKAITRTKEEGFIAAEKRGCKLDEELADDHSPLPLQ